MGSLSPDVIVADVIKDPTSPRFIWGTVPIQLAGLLALLVGNLLLPRLAMVSTGNELYATGIGLLYPVLFRFTLFSHNLPKAPFLPR